MEQPTESVVKAQLLRLVLLYFFLLIFEGALRKWVVPSLANPLLIIRDPVALLILLRAAFSKQYIVLNFYTLVFFFLTAVAFCTTLGVGHGNIWVALYGVRITAIHLPIIFVIAQALDRNDVERIGRLVLWLTPFMLILIAAQFYTPQSSFVNRGVGGDLTGSGFSGALGYFRPSGTFSFTNGATQFFGLAATFILYFWSIGNRSVSKPLLVLSTASMLMAIPFSISRSYVFQCIIAFLIYLFVNARTRKGVNRLFGLVFLLPVLIFSLIQLSFVQTAVEVITTRFTLASTSEGGLEGTLGDRFFGSLFQAVGNAGNAPFWGYGLGMGSNVGSQLLVGQRAFLIAENAWGRLIGESGALIGLSFIALRLLIVLQWFVNSLQAAFRNNPLPLFLISLGGLQMAQQNLSQPTALGFTVLTMGLVGASLKDSTKLL